MASFLNWIINMQVLYFKPFIHIIDYLICMIFSHLKNISKGFQNDGQEDGSKGKSASE